MGQVASCALTRQGAETLAKRPPLVAVAGDIEPAVPRAHAVPRLLAAVVVVGAASTDDVVFVAPPRMGQPVQAVGSRRRAETACPSDNSPEEPHVAVGMVQRPVASLDVAEGSQDILRDSREVAVVAVAVALDLLLVGTHVDVAVSARLQAQAVTACYCRLETDQVAA